MQSYEKMEGIVKFPRIPLIIVGLSLRPRPPFEISPFSHTLIQRGDFYHTQNCQSPNQNAKVLMR